MKVSVRVDVSKAIKGLSDVQLKQVPFATAQMLNTLAYDIAKKGMPVEADKTFDGGATPYTKRGFKYKKANKRKLVAYVYIDASTHEYLTRQVEGGIRTPINKKILVPTANTKLNKFGNITKGKRKSFFTNNAKYFQGTPPGRTGTAYEGVWERYGKKKSKIRMVANYVTTAKYQKKLPLKAKIKAIVKLKAQGVFNDKLRQALRNAK